MQVTFCCWTGGEGDLLQLQNKVRVENQPVLPSLTGIVDHSLAILPQASIRLEHLRMLRGRFHASTHGNLAPFKPQGPRAKRPEKTTVPKRKKHPGSRSVRGICSGELSR